MSGASDIWWSPRFLRSARSSKNPLRYSANGWSVHDVTVDRSFREQGRSDLPHVRTRSPKQNDLRTKCHPAGHINDNGSVRLPALLHLPDQRTFRITSTFAKGLALGYDALRHADNPSPGKPTSQQEGDSVKVTFPGVSAATTDIEYDLEVVAIHPALPELVRDSRFDGFRRNWLNIFQLNPRLGVLANHASSDPCAFTVFEYSSLATHMPPLAPESRRLSQEQVLR